MEHITYIGEVVEKLADHSPSTYTFQINDMSILEEAFEKLNK